jgi:hypothetical protein
MTTQETIFQSDQDSSQNQTSQTPSDTSEHLATLVGDARKYKTPDELAKAYLHLDEFAEKLKQENADLRAKVAESKTVADVLDRLNAEERQATQDQGGKKADQASSLSASDVAAIVRDTLTGMETARSRQENLLKADAEMKRLFGEKAAEVFAKEAVTPAMKKAMMDLASVSPEKFVALFQKEQPAPTGSVNGGSKVNTGALEHTDVSGRAADPECKEYYNTLRKKDPKRYYSSAVQLQMTRAATQNPTKFFQSS